MHKERAPAGKVDVSGGQFALDPVAGYNIQRAASPISWQQPFRGFLLTTLTDVAQALRSPALAETNPFLGWHSIARKLGRDYEATLRLFGYMPFIYEGEKHKRLRATLAKGLAPFSDASAIFDRRVARSLAALESSMNFDLARDFSGTLFFEILCDLMDFPEESRAAIRPLSRLSFALDATLPVRLRDDVQRTVAAAMPALAREVGLSLRSGSRNILHSIGEALPADEPDATSAIAHLATVMFLMGGDAISACVTLPVKHLLTVQASDPQATQQRWATLSDDAIRFAAPVDYLTRVATDDLSIGEFPVRRGDRIIASPLAANHDPAHFGSDAGMIRDRGGGAGMAFGAGAHMCVGARIARNVVQSAYGGLSRLPPIEPAGEADLNPGRVVRSLASLPMRFR